MKNWIVTFNVNLLLFGAVSQVSNQNCSHFGCDFEFGLMPLRLPTMLTK